MTVRIVRTARAVFSAIGLAVALLGTSTLPAFAALYHPICAARQHGCSSGPVLQKCCCGDGQSSHSDSTPGQSRVELRVNLTAVPLVVDTVVVAPSPHVPLAVDSSPPHRAALDLPTFLASLLI